jgi:DNA-damage-inducible protein D
MAIGLQTELNISGAISAGLSVTFPATDNRTQELGETRVRHKLTKSEKELSGIIFDRLHENESFGRIRSKGDMALFGGRTTMDMKKRLRVPEVRPLADFLPTITLKAKDFANEITNFNIKQNALRSEPSISGEHVKNNTEVRRLLRDRGIVPENLPPAEDVKKVERRITAERKKVSGRVRGRRVKDG